MVFPLIRSVGLKAATHRRVTAGTAPGADDVRAGLTCELGRHRTDYAGGTVHENALPRTKAAVLEQAPATRSGPALRGPHPR